MASTPSPATSRNVGVLSPYGTAGQGGNVCEWEETDFDLVNGPTLVRLLAAFAAATGAAAPASCCRRTGTSGIPTDEVVNIGFRVASISLSQVRCCCSACEALAVLWRRRFRSARWLLHPLEWLHVVCAATSAHAATIRTVALSGQTCPRHAQRRELRQLRLFRASR